MNILKPFILGSQTLCRYILIIAFASFAAAQSPESRVAERMKQYGATAVGIYYQGSDGRSFHQNADEVFHAASTMKVPVMMEIFRQVEQGKLRLDQPVSVKNEFISIMDGSSFSLTVEEDSDQEIYKLLGKNLTLREMVTRMINQSSNLATNIVIQLADAKNVMALMKEIGAEGMTVLRGVEDIKAYEAGKNNTTSARALGICLKAILDPNRFKENSRREMLDILFSQHFAEIAAGIRAKERGLKVASKDGWITEIAHDAAIVFDQKGEASILVICTRGVKEQKKGEEIVKTLAADIWNSFH